MGMGMKSLKWEGIGTKNLFQHTFNLDAVDQYVFIGYRMHCVETRVGVVVR